MYIHLFMYLYIQLARFRARRAFAHVTNWYKPQLSTYSIVKLTDVGTVDYRTSSCRKSVPHIIVPFLSRAFAVISLLSPILRLFSPGEKEVPLRVNKTNHHPSIHPSIHTPPL
jgi:hypothetical protein